MQKIKLEKRELTGKKARRLLLDGEVPAVLFNRNGESFNTKVEKGDLERLMTEATTSTIVDINYDGREVRALIKDTDFDPIRGNIRHISFFEIDPDVDMTFEIPIGLSGISPAVKNNLGVLVTPTKTVEVRGKVKDMVDSIIIDITWMANPGDTVTLGELKLPEGLTLPNQDHLDRAIVTIAQLQKLVEAEVEETEDEEDAEANEGAEGAEETETAE